MKIWFGFGSEHSMNLVIVGRFEEVSRADAAVEQMKRLKELAEREWPEDSSWRGAEERMTDSLTQALWDLKIYEMGRSDVDIFAFEHSVERNGADVRIWTEEKEIQGFIKVLLQLGARIEIYSKHDWLPDGSPRSAISE